MATVRKLPSGNWQGRYHNKGRMISAGTYPTKREALAAALHAEDQGEDTRVWFSTVAEKWRQQHIIGKSPDTARAVEMHLRRRINPVIGRRALKTLTPGDMDTLVADMTGRQGLSGSTVKQTMTTVKAVLKYAVRNGLLTASPYVDVRMPKSSPLEERALTRAETDKILTAIDDTYRNPLLVLLYTGMRRGELQGMSWQDIDFTRNTISISRSFSHTYKRFKPTKGLNTRIVPINDLLAKILEQHRAQSDYPGEPLTHYPYDDTPIPTTGLVFTGIKGDPLNGDILLREMRAAARAVGIRGKIRLHDLRHTYATWQAQAGIPLQDVQRLLGHTTVQVTERYAKYQVKDFSSILEVLNEGSAEQIAKFAPSVEETFPFDEHGEFITADEPDEDAYRETMQYGEEP